MIGMRIWKGLAAALLAAGMIWISGCSHQEGGHGTNGSQSPSKEQLQRAELFNRTADDMYQKAVKGDVAGSRAALEDMANQVTLMSFGGMTSAEGMNALLETLTEARQVFNAVHFKPEEGAVVSAKLRLAADALSHSRQPLWLQYDQQLSEDLLFLEKSAKEERLPELKQAVAQLKHHIGIIHPSLLISRQAEDVAKLDSLLTFIGNQAVGTDPFESIQNVVAPLRQMIDKLFLKKETTAYLPYAEPPNPVLWTLGIGSFILAVLIFAGWRLSKKDEGLVRVRRDPEGTLHDAASYRSFP